MVELKQINNKITALNNTGSTINALTLINIYNSSGTLVMRKANAVASSGAIVKATHILLETATNGQTKNCTSFMVLDSQAGVSGLTIGNAYLGANGAITATAPTALGDITQTIGFVTASTKITVNIIPVDEFESVDHNSTLNKQGGTTNEYYHLTNTEHTEATRNANGSQNGLLSSADWTTFNSKEPALSKGNLTASSPLNQTGGIGSVIGTGVSLTIDSATTSQKGAVQLSDSYVGTSQVLATTEKALSDGLATKQNSLGYTPENVANKENTTLDTSTTKYPTNRLIKEYVDMITTRTSMIYVDMRRIDIYVEDGSVARPFKTIAAAITSITDATSIKKYNVVVSSGVYVEQVTLKSFITLRAQCPDTVTIQYSGIVVTAPTAMNYNSATIQEIYLDNIDVSGTTSVVSIQAKGSVIFDDVCCTGLGNGIEINGDGTITAEKTSCVDANKNGVVLNDTSTGYFNDFIFEGGGGAYYDLVVGASATAEVNVNCYFHNHLYSGIITWVGLEISSATSIYVDINRVDDYTEIGTIYYPYKTIMGAINKIIANGDNSWTKPYTIYVAPGVYTENVVLEDTHLYDLIFEGTGFRQVSINPASGLALSCTTNNDNLAWLTFRNIWFAKSCTFEGASTNTWLGYNMFFENCWWTAGDILFKNLSYPIIWGVSKFSCSTVKFSNVTQAYFGADSEMGSAVSTFTIETDQTGGIKTPREWGTGTRVIVQSSLSSKDLTWSLVNITTWTGTAIQLRGSRFGSAGHTIPVNGTVLAYNSVLVGSYTNNGTLSLYNSQITGTLTGTATLYQYGSLIRNVAAGGISSTNVQSAINELDSDKADKIAPAVNHNIATLSTAGNLEDGGKIFNDLGTATTDVWSASKVTSAISTALVSGIKYKGVIDCALNPNYPAALSGDVYVISVAGKIGGASGPNVEVQDAILCKTDTVAGDHATVGMNWNIIQGNIDGAVTSADTSSTATNIVVESGILGKVVQQSLASVDGGGSINIPSGQNYKINNVQISASNLSNGITGTAGTNVVLATSPTIATPTIDSILSLASSVSLFNTSTDTQTISIGNGIAASGKVKTIDIGTSSAASSTTSVTIGSTLGTSSINIQGTLALGANSLTMTGSLATTGNRVLYGYFTDLAVTNTITGSINGNANTATTLATARAINGVDFDGSAPITVPVNNANDTSNADYYVLFTSTQGGNYAALTNTGLVFHPSTGAFSVSGVVNLANLTASKIVGTDALKNLVSVSTVGTGSVVLSSTTINGKALTGNITLALNADFSNEGTSTTVLHGNTSGPMSWSAVVEADISLSNNTTNNVTAVKHGFTPQLSNVATQFLNGQGNWTTPAGTASAYVSQSFTAQTSVVVTHNFGAYPLVQIIDDTGAVIIPLSIVNSSINAFTVTFSVSTTGNILASLGSPQLNTYTSTASDYVTIASDYIVQETGSGKTVTLITAVGRAGKIFVIKNSSAGNITVNCSGAETIDGSASITLSTLDSITVYSNGTNYYIM